LTLSSSVFVTQPWVPKSAGLVALSGSFEKPQGCLGPRSDRGAEPAPSAHARKWGEINHRVRIFLRHAS